MAGGTRPALSGGRGSRRTRPPAPARCSAMQRNPAVVRKAVRQHRAEVLLARSSTSTMANSTAAMTANMSPPRGRVDAPVGTHRPTRPQPSRAGSAGAHARRAGRRPGRDRRPPVRPLRRRRGHRDTAGSTDGDAVLWCGRSAATAGSATASATCPQWTIWLGGTDLGCAGVRLDQPAPPDRARRPGFTRNEDWDLLWVTGPVPPQPGPASGCVRLDDGAAPAINALLDVAFPDAGGAARTARSSSAGTAIWAGRDAGGLRGRPQRPAAPGVAPVGVLGGVAVHPEHRRRGLGAAVTGELTRRLQRDATTWSRWAWRRTTTTRSGCTSGWASPAATA